MYSALAPVIYIHMSVLSIVNAYSDVCETETVFIYSANYDLVHPLLNCNI